MSRVGFEPTIPVFEREKTVHVSDRAATVVGLLTNSSSDTKMSRVRDSVTNNNGFWIG
jgi:hypothetical protein